MQQSPNIVFNPVGRLLFSLMSFALLCFLYWQCRAYFPSADDLCFMNYIRDKGIFGTLDFLHAEVTFRWSGFLLMGFVLKLHAMGAPIGQLLFLSHLVLILILYASFRIRSARHAPIDLLNAAITLYFVLFLLIPFSNELFFWINAFFIYLLPIVLAILYFSLNANGVSKRLAFVLRLLLALINGGCSEAAAFSFLVLFLLEVLAVYYFNWGAKLSRILALMLFLLSLAYNLSGEGVEERLLFEAEKIQSIAQSKPQQLLNFSNYFQQMLSARQVLGLFLLFMLHDYLKRQQLLFQIKPWRSLGLALAGCSTIVLFALYFGIRLGDYGPPRMYSMAFACIAIAMLLFQWPAVKNEKWILLLRTGALLLLLFYFAPKTVETEDFRIKMQERQRLIEAWSRREEHRTLPLKALPMPPFLIYTELSENPAAVENQYWKDYLQLNFDLALRR